jgi:hypothetical protein
MTDTPPQADPQPEPAGQPDLAPPAGPSAYTHLQALDDAINYRNHKVGWICFRCRRDKKCNRHACDLRLLTTYHQMARSLAAEIAAREEQERQPDAPGRGAASGLSERSSDTSRHSRCAG